MEGTLMESPKFLLSVHALIIYEGKVLLLRRAPSNFGTGLWEMPGGKPLSTANSLPEDVMREVDEETEISITNNRLLTVYEHRIEETSESYPGWRHIMFIYLCETSKPKTPRLSEEHDDFVWAKITDLNEREFMPGQEEVIRKTLGSRL